MKSKLTYLSLAREKLVRPSGLGLCFHDSAALVLDVPGSDLVIGDLHGGGERMLHAWVEHRGMVYAPSMIATFGYLGPIDLSQYYSANDARDIHRLPYREVTKLMSSIGYQAHLRAGRPLIGKPFALVILDAAGCQWQDDGHGGVIPGAVDMQGHA